MVLKVGVIGAGELTDDLAFIEKDHGQPLCFGII